MATAAGPCPPRASYHYNGNAYGSTLRLTLGALLAEELDLTLRRVGSSGTRLTVSEREQTLSAWMCEHARACWPPDPQPWLLETHLIHDLILPPTSTRTPTTASTPS